MMGGAMVEDLRRVVGPQNVFTEDEAVEPYSHDEFAQAEIARRPLAVVRPQNAEEISRIVLLCSKAGVGLTARGGGTGLSAAAVPQTGGIVLSLELMRRVVDRDSANLTITVQAGCTLSGLFQAVDEMGLFFPPHPGDEGAFVGGVVATNAGGSRAVKYGTVRRFVTGLQVVCADGEIVRLGGKIRKSSTGYDLLDLMIGSEGTLGIIAEVTLALLPPAGTMYTLVSPFDTVSAAIECVPALLHAGIVPCAVEFVAHSVLRCAERFLERSWPTSAGRASLMIILDGRTEDEVLAQAEALAEPLESGGALDVLIAEQKEKQKEILELRSMLYEALRPGTVELFDICVPLDQVAPHVGLVHEFEERLGVVLPSYGHAADGNIHTHSLRCRLEDGVIGEEIPDWKLIHEQVKEAIYEDAIGRGGVISGEHGVGLVKRDYLERNLGAAQVAMMAAIKRGLDPKGILNPGKVLPR